MKFIDQTVIRVRAGKGGDGIASFKSAKGAPKLGPDGGDGGRGGSVIFEGRSGMSTLSNLRYRAMYRAEDGQRGGANGRTGARGEDLVIQVPLGTIAVDKHTGEHLAEVLHHGQQIVVAKGGRHGLGNMHWTSSTHQVPEEFRPGADGEEHEVAIELRLIADNGLAGFPNAGKSTLLSRISAARPKIADYPFTTLVPNLGVVEIVSKGSQYSVDAIVVADVPGLIEGASVGKGLGHAFLKHLERTSLIAFIVDGNDLDAKQTLQTLKNELSSFGTDLASKRSIVIVNKIDLLDDELVAQLKADLGEGGVEVIACSALDGRGLDDLKYRLHALVKEEKDRRRAEEAEAERTGVSPNATKVGLVEPESFPLAMLKPSSWRQPEAPA
jgi:GTP-binding protein